MPAYSYKARNYLGELVEGVVNARNPEELDQHMANLDLILVKASQIKEEKKSTKKRIKRRDLILFSIHIATSLEAGVPIISALTDFAESTDNSIFKNILAGIVKQIEEKRKQGSAKGDIFPKSQVIIFIMERNLLSREHKVREQSFLPDASSDVFFAKITRYHN